MNSPNKPTFLSFKKTAQIFSWIDASVIKLNAKRDNWNNSLGKRINQMDAKHFLIYLISLYPPLTWLLTVLENDHLSMTGPSWTQSWVSNVVW